MLKYRLISFPLLLLMAFLVVLWREGGAWIFAALVIPVTVAAVLESCNIAARLGMQPLRITAVLAAVLLMAKYALGDKLLEYRAYLPNGAWVVAILFTVLMLATLFMRDREKAVKAAFVTPGVVLLPVIVLLPLAKIYFEYGSMMFLMLVLCTKASDTGGYIVGMLSNKVMKNGNHKIVPSISPKKSWEGTVGAALFSMITALCFAFNSWWICLIFGFLAFLGSFAGDLTESQLKRVSEIKDSGSWIPGMGGILDVIDSFIYNAPLFYLVLESGGF